MSAAGVVLALSVLGLGAGDAAHDELLLRLPGRDWSLHVGPCGVEFGAAHVVEDGSAAWAGGDGVEIPFVVRVVLRAVDGASEAADCAARAEARMGLDSAEVRDVTRARRGAMATVEYLARGHAGVRVDQRNLHAFLWHDGACAEIGLSMMEDPPGRRAAFARVLDAVAVVAPVDR